MRIHRNLFYITLVLSFTSLVLSWRWHSSNENNYLSNVMLAIFGSGFLVMLSSMAGYFVERYKYRIKCIVFARNFKERIMDSYKIYNKQRHSAEALYREILTLISFYDSFAFENSTDIHYYFYPNGKPRR